MNTAAPGPLVLALLAAGLFVVVVAAVGAVVTLRVYDRLHLVSPVTSLGAPLIGLALMIHNGWSLASGEIFVVVALLVATGPALAAATGRLTGQREGFVARQSPQ